MKERLRKKKHYGEFTEGGPQLDHTRNRKDGFDEFLDAFIKWREEAFSAIDTNRKPGRFILT